MLLNVSSLCSAAALLLIAGAVSSAQPSSPCPPDPLLLQKNNPVYADAMDLAQTLRGQGFEIECMFPSKTGSMFMVAKGDALVSTIEGEVVYVTKDGGFDAFFMPKPQNFAGFGIRRLHSSRGFLYAFSGTPAVWPANSFGTASRNYFFKRDNYMLIATTEAMSARLEHALGVKPESP